MWPACGLHGGSRHDVTLRPLRPVCAIGRLPGRQERAACWFAPRPEVPAHYDSARGCYVQAQTLESDEKAKSQLGVQARRIHAIIDREAAM